MYEQLGNIVCRKATLDDLTEMYKILVNYSNNDIEARKLMKFLRYYIKNSLACVVTVNNLVVGVYAGKDNFIHYFSCKGSVKAALLLTYVVLCGINNKYEDSKFIAFDSNIDIFYKLKVNKDIKVCSVDKSTMECVISYEVKRYIEKLYYRLVRGYISG